jgi:hypothetical protein
LRGFQQNLVLFFSTSAKNAPHSFATLSVPIPVLPQADILMKAQEDATRKK